MKITEFLAPYYQAFERDDTVKVEAFAVTLRNEGTTVVTIDKQLNLQPNESVSYTTDGVRGIKTVFDIRFAKPPAGQPQTGNRLVFIQMRPTNTL